MTRILAFLLAVCLLLVAGPVVAPASAAAPEHRSAQRVHVYDYDLGADAFHVRGFNAMKPSGMPSDRLAPIELTGRAYVPDDAAGRRLPLVVIAHGLFWTCADNATGKLRQDWPCRGSYVGIHSDRGYDYLGRTLAQQGMLVVSVGANGVNAGEMGEVADRARAAIVYKHLRLWRDLVQHGTGPLSRALTDAASGRSVQPDLRGAADLHDVGLLGHSRGGRGVMWAAADAHRDLVPHGVRLRAVFGMASAEPPFMDHGVKRLTVGRIPVMTWSGTCDPTGRDEYNVLARQAHNRVNIGITVHGANHNNLNSRWSAHSGLPGGEDDAAHPQGRPGKCYVQRVDGDQLDDSLGYRAEQRVASTYVGAFFGRYLQGKVRYDGVLSGERKPVRELTKVEVRRY